MTFAELLSQIPQAFPADEAVRVVVPKDWAQGRASFGGALTGLGLTAMQALVPQGDAEPRRTCRSMLVSFAGPVAPGEVELAATLVRHGRSATHTSASFVQDQSLRCTIMASFASDRESVVDVAAPSRPELAGPEGLVSLPVIDGVIPAFASHFEMRWASGGFPMSGSKQSSYTGWVRFRERHVGLGPSWIAALVDAWPAPVLQQLRKPAFASSLTWALDFIDHDHQDNGAASDQWWAFAVDTDRAAGGWVHTRARLWSPTGVLVATSSQTVALFA